MVIETGRLRLVPLDADMLEVLTNDVAEFEKEYSAKYDGEEVGGRYKEILLEKAKEVRADEDNAVFLTMWLIELKGVVIGSIDFKHAPKDGATEIAYGLNKKYEGKGYMTESVKGLLKFASLLGLKRVFAETREDNVKSEKVLERCGFDLISDGKLKKWGKNL